MSVFFEIRKNGTKAWYYDFMYHRIRYRGVGGTSKTQALRALEKRRNEVMNEEFGIKIRPSIVLIQDFADKYLTRRTHMRSHKRDELSVRTLLKFFRNQTLHSIKPYDIEDYKTKRIKDGVANATVNRELACLKHMYNLAIKWEDALRNPVKDVDFLEEPPGRTRFLDEEECQRLLDCCGDHLKPIVMTALHTGMRKGEILLLTWKQVHIDRVINPFIELTETKNNKKRFIPLTDNMVQLLLNMPRQSEYMFLNPFRKQPMECIRKSFGNALERAGITDFRFHDLRHTFASHFIMSGGDMLTLKSILGHSSMKMVERYAHLAKEHMVKQIKNLDDKFTICQSIASSRKTA
jgi:integrase